MSCGAVIYIRTSSETQGGKSSPSEQEVDCQTLAAKKDYSWFMFIAMSKNIEWETGWSNLRAAVQIDLPCKPCSKMPPEINSILSSPGVKTGCITEYE